MSLKLSPQLDANASAAFALYTSYFEENKRLFPQSVIKLVESDDWNGGYMSNSPHDSCLTKVNVDSIGTKDAKITIELSKPHLALEIIIVYSGVLKFDFPEIFRIDEALEWRFEQFLFFNPYDDFGIKEKNMFKHNIEWVTGDVWTIIASDIEVTWNSKNTKNESE